MCVYVSVCVSLTPGIQVALNSCLIACMIVIHCFTEPKGPKEQREELATIEIFEGLFKFSGVVTSENKAWLSVAATFL